jgi:hypothetical protein
VDGRCLRVTLYLVEEIRGHNQHARLPMRPHVLVRPLSGRCFVGRFSSDCAFRIGSQALSGCLVTMSCLMLMRSGRGALHDCRV